MDGRCATCKHWIPFDPERDYREMVRANKLGLCVMASGHMDGDIKATYDDASGNETLEADGTVAAAIDGSDYRRDFRTAATFGCVQWVSR